MEKALQWKRERVQDLVSDCTDRAGGQVPSLLALLAGQSLCSAYYAHIIMGARKTAMCNITEAGEKVSRWLWTMTVASYEVTEVRTSVN